MAGRNGYQAIVGGNHRMRQIMGQLAAEAEGGDARAAQICQALREAGCNPPGFMRRQLAPGVNAPCEDLFPLPLAPKTGTNVFTAAGATSITLTGNSQKPFQGQRPVALVTRIGGAPLTIVPVIRGGIRVGTSPQVAQAADMPLEFFDRTSFGVRMVMEPAEPGIDIEVDIALTGPALGAGESIAVWLAIFGDVYA